MNRGNDMTIATEHPTLKEGTVTAVDAALHELYDALPENVISVWGDDIVAHAQDHSIFAPHRASALITPETVDQVSATLAIANRHHVPVFTWGRGTGMAGSATPTADGVILSTERLDRIIDINPIDETITVEAGVITADINKRVERYGLFYAPDPASAAISSIGGNIATNAGGFHCVKYGVTKDSVLSLTVVLADGSVIETGRHTIKNVSGLDVTSLFVGSEGLLGVVVRATLRLRPRPTATATVVAFVPDIEDTGKGVEAVVGSHVQPSVCEMLEVLPQIRASERFAPIVGDKQWMLLIQTDGEGASTDAAKLKTALEAVGATAVKITDPKEVDWLFELRRSGKPYPTDAWLAGGDVAVPLSKLAGFLGTLTAIADRHGFTYQIVAHVGDGNIHSAFFASKSVYSTYPEALNDAHREMVREALAIGGSLTGEHGIGLELKAYLADQIGEHNLELQRAIKRVYDPNGILNPGKWL